MSSFLKIAVMLLIAYSAASETVSAVGIDFYSIDISVKDTASTKLTITFDSQIESFSLSLGKLKEAPRIVSASANKGFISCKASLNDEGKAILACNIQGAPEGRNTILLEMDYGKYVETIGDKNSITTFYESRFDTKSLSVSFILPERAALSEDPPQNSISPRNGDIKTDGKKIFIFWNRQNVTSGDTLIFSSTYTLPDQRESPINTVLLLPIIIILAALVWFVIKSKKKTIEATETAAVSVLSKEEKVLFDILKINKGSANQKVLVRESNFSKAKVSRLLKGLKERGVVEIEPVSGRENKVLLLLGQPREIKKAVEKAFEKEDQRETKQDENKGEAREKPPE